MARKKTTVYVDEDLLRAAKVYAARRDLRDSDVIESALAKFLGLDLFESVWERNRDLDPDDATEIAYEELDAVRAERRARKR
ncbi:MAG: hypothetical protein EDR02_11285 [Actinobacteria bacterium]|nr:MAG: hypothetical protein EDR02_11285 [Actinomycetota bacterium]